MAIPNGPERVEESFESSATPTGERTRHVVSTSPTQYEGSTQGAMRQKRFIFRAHQIIWYLLGIIEVLLVFRFFLKLTGANPVSGFVDFIYTASGPFAAPFIGIFRISAVGPSVFEWSTLIAMVVYALVAWGLVWLFQLVKPVSRDEVEHEV